MRNSKRYLSLALAAAMVFPSAISATAAAGDSIPQSQALTAGQNYDQYPALKDVYKDYFMVGTVGPLDGSKSDLIKYHFNAYTPENEMKPENVQKVKGTFTFDTLNNLLSNVKNLSSDIKLIGHTLAWHSQSPSWLWDAPSSDGTGQYGQPGTYDHDTALANLQNHIDTVLDNSNGELYSVDVVNEAIGTANPNDWQASLMKNEGWALALGSDWVEQAFLEAAKVVDAHGWNTKLYYNDFGLDGEAKSQTVYAMVKAINEKYAGTRPNGKPLIEGIGMQGHYDKNAKPEDTEKAIQLFSTLPGVSVSITEMDIGFANSGSLTEEQAVQQGQIYAQLFQIFKKYAAGSANTTNNPKVIERVTLWGSNDGNSWKSGSYPLLFNADLTGKEALLGVLDPDAYLALHPVVNDPGSGPEPVKHIDGVYVYDKNNNGDGYTGANIILGNDANAWPWSTAGADGKTAFTPEKDATYRISVNVTMLGASAIRVRWLKDESNGGYTSGDAANVNKYTYSATQVATTIPAYFNSGMVNAGTYTLKTEVKLDGSQLADGLIGNIAIRGGAGSNDFVTNWITVEKIGTGGASDKLLVNWPDGLPTAGTQGVHVYDKNNNGDGYTGANIILGDNANEWPWSTPGADGLVAFTPEKDATYRISTNITALGANAIRVRWLKDESNGGYTSGDAANVNKYTYSASQVATTIPAYFNSGITTGNSYTLVNEVKLDGSQLADGLIGNIAIRGGAGSNDFTINWIKVEKIGVGGAPDQLLVNWPDGIDDTGSEPEPEEPAIPPAGLTYDNYPALKDVYKDYFTVGIFGSGETNALIHNFAEYAPGNEMKPESTQKVKGVFTYDSADNAFNNLASLNPDMLFYGHTLAWHSQTPDWMWDAPASDGTGQYGQPGTYDRDTALNNLNNHIENVLGHFGGRLTGVDVVNEAVGTPVKDSTGAYDWKASLSQDAWDKAIGSEWVEDAFLKAADVVDKNGWDTKLIYNDFGLDSPAKAQVVYEMVKDINEKYAGKRPNGKPLIEVIGMQEHDNLNTNVANVESAIKLFATLPGVKVNITEMDIGSPAVGTLTPENENNQAMKFAELFQVFKKYATGPANTTDNPKVIDRVSICGVRDATTGWRAGEFALLFTSDGYAKQSLVAVLDPDAFVATHDYIEPETGPEVLPVDGVHIYDMSKDGWSGANIILGNDANSWPWSKAGDDGKVAFAPEKDATYRLSFNYTSNGTSAIRLRWVQDDTNGTYTAADTVSVNAYQYSASQIATTIPAYFNSGMVAGSAYTLVTEFKLDGSQPADGLIGNIAIRGGGGGNAFAINWIKVEKVGTNGAPNQLLVSWPKEEEPANRPPVLNAIGNQTVNEGSPLQFTVSGTDPDNDPLTYSASNLPQGSSFNPSTGVFSWTPDYTQAGTYSNIVFTVSDGDISASEAVTITVQNVSPGDLIDQLISYIKNLNLPNGTENSFVKKLENANSSIDRGNENAAENQLEALIQEVSAQKGKAKNLPDSEADSIISRTQLIMSILKL